MKKLLVTILAVICVVGITSLALAQISLNVSAQATSGTKLGTHAVLKCKGYSYNQAGDPWTQCTNQGAVSALSFGTLSTNLKNSSGVVTEDAGCFYAEDFFIVYLFPDAWGGKGYDLKQGGTISSTSPLYNAFVRTAVYSKDDKYSGQPAQGDLNATETTNNPQLGKTYLVRDTTNNRIFKSKRGRIVRAEYGIPPNPGTGQTRPTGWVAIPKETLAGTYSVALQITLTEWQ